MQFMQESHSWHFMNAEIIVAGDSSSSGGEKLVFSSEDCRESECVRGLERSAAKHGVVEISGAMLLPEIESRLSVEELLEMFQRVVHRDERTAGDKNGDADDVFFFNATDINNNKQYEKNITRKSQMNPVNKLVSTSRAEKKSPEQSEGRQIDSILYLILFFISTYF
jgi:hypothetical protein